MTLCKVINEIVQATIDDWFIISESRYELTIPDYYLHVSFDLYNYLDAYNIQVRSKIYMRRLFRENHGVLV